MSIAEAAFSFTTKVNGDLLTARADNIFDMKKRLEDMAEMLGDAAAVSALAQATTAAQPITAPATPLAAAGPPAVEAAPPPLPPVGPTVPAGIPPAVNPQPAQAAQAAQPEGPAPTCIHGQRNFRQSKPGAQKTWAAFMCASPQGATDKCEPIWVRD